MGGREPTTVRSSRVQFCELGPVAICLLLGGAFPAPTVRAQNTPQPAATGAHPSFRISVNLVQVDALVTDDKGNRISNLTPADFHVTENGKQQTIVNVAWIDTSAPRAARATVAGAPPAMQKEQIRRSMVLMFDDSGPWTENDMLPVVTAARKFVNEKLAPGDLVSVTASRGSMGFFEQLTSDPRQLNAAIDRILQRPGFGRWTVAPPVTADENGNFVPIRLKPGEPAYDVRSDEPPDPVGHLMWAIQGLRNLPGRKAIVLFSHHFPAPPSIIDLANRAGVAIYVIDPHGVDMAVEQRGMHMSFSGQTVPGSAPYRKLARDTGGLFFLSSPGANLVEDLAKVAADLSGYYLIAYRAQRTDAELAGRPARHDLQVTVLRKGLLVRTRTGAADSSNPPPANPRPLPTAEALRQALVSPFNAGGIRLRLDTAYGPSSPDPKTRLRHPMLSAMIVADGKDVHFADVPPGRKRAVYSVLIGVFRQNGAPETSQEGTVTADLTPRQAAQLTASGLHGVLHVELPGPGTYQVRAAVRDENSGDTGSAYLFVDVPDFNRPQLALSSIQLSKPDVPPEGAAQWDSYRAGTVVHFEAQLFGFRIDSHSQRQPQVEMRVLLFADATGAATFDSGPVPVPPSTLAENFLAGSIRIGADFEPGDYTVEVLAYDRLAPKKKQIAAQRTHLTVVSPPKN
jgi:VWFA-related protein